MPMYVVPAGEAGSVSPVIVPLVKTIGGTEYAGPEPTDPEQSDSYIPTDPDPPADYVEIAYRPTPVDCQGATFYLWQAEQKKAEFDAMKAIFDNDHADIAIKITEGVAGVAATLGLGANAVAVFNRAKQIAEVIKGSISASLGALGGVFGLAVAITLYIDSDRWGIAVTQAKADKARLCGSSGT